MKVWNLKVFVFLIIIKIRLHVSASNCLITLRTFGDSHSETPLIEAFKNIPNHLKHHFKGFTYSGSGKLMFSMARDGINITELLKTPKMAYLRPWAPHERRYPKFNLKVPGVVLTREVGSAPAISERDILYFDVGEVDARQMLGLRIQKGLLRIENVESEINGIVDRYVARIKSAVEEVPAKTVWIGGLFAQPLVNENIIGASPITGSWSQRQLHVELINKRLKMHSEKEGFVFMDFSEGYSNPGGDLNMTMSDGNHHLNVWTEKTKNEFAAKFVEQFERFCGHAI